MIQINDGAVKMHGPLNIICGECGAVLMTVAERLAKSEKISLRNATEKLITAIYDAIPIWEEKENRP